MSEELLTSDDLTQFLDDYATRRRGHIELDLPAFVDSSPVDTTDTRKVWTGFEGYRAADLEAARSHAERTKERYLSRLQEIQDADPQEVTEWWVGICETFKRRVILDTALTLLLHSDLGPKLPSWEKVVESEDYSEDYRKAKQTATTGAGTNNPKREIAEYILKVLRNGDQPESMTELLNRVDRRRGMKERTTYRYLYEHTTDHPTTVRGWEKWAKGELGM